ncbi:MAG: arginine N-succinyltransferase [Pseudomonadota bacterium]
MSKALSLIIRSVALDDLDALMDLSRMTGAGMTNMPVDEDYWRGRIKQAVASAHRCSPDPDGDLYYLVLEDADTEAIVGSCAIFTRVGVNKPFYNYKLSTLTSSSARLGVTKTAPILSLVNDFTGKTELGSLFVHPDYRRDGIGRALSRSRFLFIADFRDRIDDEIFAELRGWIDENGESPFWKHMVSKFIDVDFAEADRISGIEGSQFISDMMPKYPVYVDLLHPAAVEVIGKLHDNTHGARRILEKEGLTYNGYVDIFDAGPAVSAPTDRIETVSSSELRQVVTLDLTAVTERLLISNVQLPEYRVLVCDAQRIGDDEVAICAADQQTLGISAGSAVRIAQF